MVFSSAQAQALVDLDGQVIIDTNAITDFCTHRFNGGDGDQHYHDHINRVAFPLKFDHPLQEINFHALCALLSFGSAFEEKLGETARDVVLFGLIGVHISKIDPNAGWLCATNRSEVAGLFGIETFERVPAFPPSGNNNDNKGEPRDAVEVGGGGMVEEAKEQRSQINSAITIERPGPLSGYVDNMVKAMHDTGGRLRELGCADLARFILNAIKGEQHSAARLVEALATTFVHFEDVVRLEHVEVRLRKKAVLLAAELYHRVRQVRRTDVMEGACVPMLLKSLHSVFEIHSEL